MLQQRRYGVMKITSTKALLALALLALPATAHAQYGTPSNYDRHGNYIIRPPSISTTITPNGTYTTAPINPQHPWAGSTTTGPGVFCTTTPNVPTAPAYGSTTVCR